MNFSLIVPVYNEEDNVERLLKRLKDSLGGNPHINSYEILCIEDGSTDKTFELLQRFKTPEVKIIKFKKNSGQSAAIAAGIKYAQYEMLGIIDGDLQTDPDDFIKLLDKQKKGYDCVSGARIDRKDNASKKFSTWFARKMRNWILNDGFYDITCPLKVLTKESIQNITFYNTFHRFVPYLVKMQGYKVIEIPVRHYHRIAGKSKYGVWNRLFAGVWSLYAVKWMSKNYISYEVELND